MLYFHSSLAFEIHTNIKSLTRLCLDLNFWKCRPSRAAELVRLRVAAAKEATSASVLHEPPDASSGALPARRAMNLCEDLFRDHPGTLIRERCRDEMFAKDESESVRDLVYGEFGFLSLVAFFKKHRDKIPRRRSSRSGGGDGAVCYDLGSGVGRPVFAAATLHPFAKVVGMECLQGLHALGTELVQLYDAEAGREREREQLGEYTRRKGVAPQPQPRTSLFHHHHHHHHHSPTYRPTSVSLYCVNPPCLSFVRKLKAEAPLSLFYAE